MNYNGAELGLVVATYPEGNSVDVLLDSDGSRLSNVQVAVMTGSDMSGEVDLPDIGGPVDDTRWDPTAKRTLYMRAIITFFRGLPVVTGFLLPQVTQMTFARKNFRVKRHASQVHSSINDNGDVEFFHPSGTFLRIAESAAHEDLTGQDFDKKFAVSRNTARQVHVHLELHNGGTINATLDIDPSGNVTVTHAGNLSWHAQGTASIQSDGDMTLTAPNLTVAAATNVTGATLEHHGTNVGSTHVHGGVTSGGSSTTGPS